MELSTTVNGCTAMEAFFATLTKECTGRVRFQTRQEARSAVFEYLECFYNPVRLHSTLQYVSPVAFEQHSRSHGMKHRRSDSICGGKSTKGSATGEAGKEVQRATSASPAMGWSSPARLAHQE